MAPDAPAYPELTLDKREFEAKLSAWAQGVLAHLPQTSPENRRPKGSEGAVAIDGKSLRGSHKQGACEAYLLSAVSHGLGLTLFEHAVPDKTNELGAVRNVLKSLVLEGRAVTVDALLTHKAVAEAVTDKGGTS